MTSEAAVSVSPVDYTIRITRIFRWMFLPDYRPPASFLLVETPSFISKDCAVLWEVVVLLVWFVARGVRLVGSSVVKT